MRGFVSETIDVPMDTRVGRSVTASRYTRISSSPCPERTAMSMKLSIPAALAIAAFALPAHAGKTLDGVKARGQLVCGVNTSGPGFSNADSQGRWTGLDVD